MDVSATPATSADGPPCNCKTAKSLDMFVEKSTESTITLSVLLLPPDRIPKKVGADQLLDLSKISLRSVLKPSAHQTKFAGDLCHPETTERLP